MMTQPSNTKRGRRTRADSVRAAVERSRAGRLRRTERRLLARLDDLYQLDRREYRALVRLLGNVLAHERRRGR